MSMTLRLRVRSIHEPNGTPKIAKPSMYAPPRMAVIMTLRVSRNIQNTTHCHRKLVVRFAMNVLTRTCVKLRCASGAGGFGTGKAYGTPPTACLPCAHSLGNAATLFIATVT